MTLPITGPLSDGGRALTPPVENDPFGQSIGELGLPRPAEGTEHASEVTFGGILMGAVEHANRLETTAAARTEALAAGATDDIHGTMIAVREAEITTTLVSSIRTKLLDAFHELWRTGV